MCTRPLYFQATFIEGKPPIYVGLYVDDSIYYSCSDTVEALFQTKLAEILGTFFQWDVLCDGCLQCHMLQQAFTEGMLEKFNMSESISARSPYQSGYIIDRIPHDVIPPENKADLVTQYHCRLFYLVINQYLGRSCPSMQAT